MTKMLKPLAAIVVAGLLGACSGTPDKAKPAELAANPGLMGVKLAWSHASGRVDFPLQVKVVGSSVYLASSEGRVESFDAQTGQALWTAQLSDAIAAGVGSDGKLAAVVTAKNDLVALQAGREVWRQRLSAQVFTAPLVAGGRVFVLGGDRGVSAFDAVSGRRLWTQARPGEPLVLRQAGVLMAVGDTLVVGLSGKLVGMNPLNGGVRWETAIASPRGTNDVERLVDMVAGVGRDADTVCVRAFQAAVGCVNASRGVLQWNKPASGHVGVHGDDRFVIGTESDGKVIAWRRADGERAWVSERFRFRGLTAPMILGRSVAFGDESGLVHFVGRDDGALLTRAATDGSPIVSAPTLAGETLIVVTRNGGVFGFRPE